VDAVPRRTLVAVALAVGLAACASSAGSLLAPTTNVPSTAATTTSIATTVPTTTIPPAADPSTSPPGITAKTPAVRTDPPGPVGKMYEIGRSVEGRPITVIERGDPGGKAVLVVGVIHGNEPAGVQIVRDLAVAPLSAGLHLYLVEAMNPDGLAHNIRTNVHEVDLNRNFPLKWAPLGQPGDWQYAGPGPASEPETQAMVDFTNRIRPELAIWYHQDLYRLSPATGAKGVLVQRYSALTGLPIVPVTGGTYTGTATPWQESVIDGSIAFIVELGPTLSDHEAASHAAAVLDISSIA
jgi:murein peptide amidase A